MRHITPLVLLALGACASREPAAPPTAPDAARTPTSSQQPPADAAGMFAFVKAGSYRSWPVREPSLHPSRGPHSRRAMPVRVFYNQALADSLGAGGGEHPAGAAVVKEMYTDRGVLRGWAVMVKTANASAEGDGWYWYEVTSVTSGDSPVAADHGVDLCSDCHEAGADYVLSRFPPR
jgi:Cytochrome P460